MKFFLIKANHHYENSNLLITKLQGTVKTFNITSVSYRVSTNKTKNDQKLQKHKQRNTTKSPKRVVPRPTKTTAQNEKTTQLSLFNIKQISYRKNKNKNEIKSNRLQT